MIDASRMIRWLAESGLDYRSLAHKMKWSPSYIYGYLGGAWDVSPQFQAAFRQTFGSEIANSIFQDAEEVSA